MARSLRVIATAVAMVFILSVFVSSAFAANYIGEYPYLFTYAGVNRKLYSNCNGWKSGSTGTVLEGGHAYTWYAPGGFWVDWTIPSMTCYAKITNPAGTPKSVTGTSNNVTATSRNVQLTGGSGTWKAAGTTTFYYAAPYYYAKSYSGTFN